MNATLTTAAYVLDDLTRDADVDEKMKKAILQDIKTFPDPARHYYHWGQSTYEAVMVHEEQHQWQYFEAGKLAFESIVKEIGDVHGPATSVRQLEIIADIYNQREANGDTRREKLNKATSKFHETEYSAVEISEWPNFGDQVTVDAREADAQQAAINYLLATFGGN